MAFFLSGVLRLTPSRASTAPLRNPSGCSFFFGGLFNKTQRFNATGNQASRYLTSSLTEFSQSSGLGEAFLGTIVLPIAGNACEHMTAVIVATKNKMDLPIS
ncbi:hypothetical protein Vafri_22017 [Volvox africanus]|uniref:Sodium/calcium exchanger membrane region domain-containing protein n=1 Tax=Volvox africanus TaxID=51714 RepID=A0A8J4FEI0_9CHLO|nr:hypothetical protein Vafri_22017 [Volvox africanus]